MARACFKLVIKVHERIPPPCFAPDFEGPGIVEIAGRAKSWKEAQDQGLRLMHGLHHTYGNKIRVTFVTPGDQLRPFYMNEEGFLHYGLPPEIE